VASDAEVSIDPEIAPYGQLYNLEANDRLTSADLFAEMEANGIRGILQAEYETGASRPVNLRVAELLRHRPDLLLGGIATVDPREPDALDELRWAHQELGLRGWVFQPGFLQVYPTDTRCFPIYEYCEQEGHPVTIHTGVNFSRSGPIEYGRPTWADQVACAFPNLVVVLNHGGWPWVAETIAVLWKHENAYADFGAVAPKYMADPRGEWGHIAHWMNTQLRSKVLLGTDWPMLHYERLLAELPLLGLSDAAYAAYTHGNALRLIEQVWR